MDRGNQPLLRVRAAYRGPYALAVFEDGIAVGKSSLTKRDLHRVRYDQMTQVSVRYHLVLADLIVETRGGDTLEVRGLSAQDPERASTVIRELMATGAARGTDEPATLDIPDQIRKLAELRDSGAITDEEFQAKKMDLLDRM